jgi:hypothetical protein
MTDSVVLNGKRERTKLVQRNQATIRLGRSDQPAAG